MIGLEINRDNFVVVEVKEKGDGTTLTKYAISQLDTMIPAENIVHDVGQAVKKVFADNKFDDKEVYTSIGGSAVLFRRITLPLMPNSELGEAVKYEAKNFVPFAIETATVDYFPLTGADVAGGKQDLFVVVAENKILKRHLDILSEAGLKCAGITPAPFAFWGLTKYYPEFSGESLTALINITSESASLNIFKQNELLFSREIDFSGKDIVDQLAASFNLDAEKAEALIVKYGLPDLEQSGKTAEDIDFEQLRQVMYTACSKLQNELISSIEYFQAQFSEARPAHVYLTGGMASLRNLPAYLSSTFTVPIQLFDPIKAVKLDANIKQDELQPDLPYLTLPLGLALGKCKEINLLKSKAKEKRPAFDVMRILDFIQIPTAGIVAFLIVMMAMIFGFNIYLSYSINAVKKDFNTKTAKLSQLTKLRDRRSAFKDIAKQEIDIKLLLAHINYLMPKSVSLTQLNFDNVSRQVQVGGESKTASAASDFVKNVEISPYFYNALLIEIKKFGDVITFQMHFKVK